MKGLIDLCFPRSCAVCGRELLPQEEVLCVYCLSDLPLTHFWKRMDNPVAECFWGRVPFTYAASYLYFRDISAYRKLLHRLKYTGDRRIGPYMGRLFGRELCRSAWSDTSFTLVPVPMQKAKQRKRGYNQAEMLAQGISQATLWPLDSSLLWRVSEKESQTTKSRWERWVNVKDSFRAKLILPDAVLLVDDVITTGATLEACAQALLKEKPNLKIGFASLSFVE